MRVLVTGGAGYIGSHTAKALAAAGHIPVVFDNLSTGHRWAVKWGPFVQGDIADRELVRKVIHQYSIEAVIHFAASAYVGESVQRPREYFHNNVINSLALLDVVLEARMNQLVFSSSCATYGLPASLPIDEAQPQRPINPYGESKLFVERALAAYDAAYGLKPVSLRYFNAAGADPDGDLGENHTPETHIIPLVIESAIGRRERVDIFGTDYSTSDGTAIRDFIHVTDLANAHVLALDYLSQEGNTTAFNLGTGTGISVRDIIAAVEAVSEQVVPVRVLPRRAGDPPELIANAQRAQSILGWEPLQSTLASIVCSAWKWHSGGQLEKLSLKPRSEDLPNLARA